MSKYPHPYQTSLLESKVHLEYAVIHTAKKNYCGSWPNLGNSTCLLWGSPNGSASWTLFFFDTLGLSAAAASSPLCSSIGPVGAQIAVTWGWIEFVSLYAKHLTAWRSLVCSLSICTRTLWRIPCWLLWLLCRLYLLHLAGSVIVGCHAASFLFDFHSSGLQEAIPDRALGHISSAIPPDLHLDTNRTNKLPLVLINAIRKAFRDMAVCHL